MANKKDANNTAGILEVNIPAIDLRMANIKIVGDTPLIMHKWSEKAKKQILDKETGKAKTKKHDIKDPVREFIDSMYWLEGEPEDKTEEGFAKAIQNGARFGFPAISVKAAAVAAGYRTGITKNQVIMRGAFHIDDEFIEINGTPVMREDPVVVGGQTRGADLRYRGMFEKWSSVITVKYNAGAVTLEQLVNLFNLGGFCCGLGEWRIEKGGTYGAFHVE